MNTRREFVGKLGKAGLAVAAFGGTVRTFGSVAGTGGGAKLGVAIVGLGGFASQSILPELGACSRVRLAGLVTGDPKGKGAEWAKRYGVPLSSVYHYSEMGRMAENSAIDFVHVATPNGLHRKHTEAAAAAGKHVLCEKPMATTSADCRSMIETCRKAGVALGIDYRLHWEPHHQKLMELGRDKVYGEVRSIHAEFSWHRGDWKPWLLDKELAGGGAFFDTGVYVLQAGCYIVGETPVRILAIPTTTRAVYPEGIEETMHILAEFRSGAGMTARVSYAYGNHTLSVNTTGGGFSCEGAPGGSVFGQSYDGKPSGKQVRLGDGRIFKAEDRLQQATLLDAFAESIQTGKTFLCPGEMGLRDLVMTEAVYESARTGKAVEVSVG